MFSFSFQIVIHVCVCVCVLVCIYSTQCPLFNDNWCKYYHLPETTTDTIMTANVKITIDTPTSVLVK